MSYRKLLIIAAIVFAISILAILFYPLTYIHTSIEDEMNAGLLYRADGKIDPNGFDNFVKIIRIKRIGFNKLSIYIIVNTSDINI